MKNSNILSKWSSEWQNTSTQIQPLTNISNQPFNEEVELWGIVQIKNSEIEELKKRVGSLESDKKIVPRVISIIEVSFDEAKKMIENYIKKNKSADMEKLQNELHLDLETIYNATKQLEREGKLKSKPL